MGGIISCCCPDEEEGTPSTNDDVYGVGDNEETPLLVEGPSYGGTRGIGNNLAGSQDSNVGSSFDGGRRGIAPSSLLNASDVNNTRMEISEMAQRLQQIERTSADTFLDCSNSIVAAGGGGHVVTTSATVDVGELLKRSELNEKRLSSNSAVLVARNLAELESSGLGTGGHLVDVHLDGQLSEDLLSEADQMLAREVANRAKETLVEREIRAHSNLVVPFGMNSE